MTGAEVPETERAQLSDTTENSFWLLYQLSTAM